MGSKSNIDYTFKHCRKGHYYQGDECPYCKAQKQSFEVFKQCPNGHYYRGDYCPYCKEDNQSFEDGFELHDGGDMIGSRDKVCINGHFYSPHHRCCPYCGENVVKENVDVTTANRTLLKIEFVFEITIEIERFPAFQTKILKLFYTEGFNKTRGYYGLFHPDLGICNIVGQKARIGNKDFSANEFIKWIDVIIDDMSDIVSIKKQYGV